MNFDEALRKFKKGDSLLKYCLSILKPQILRVLKESDEYHSLHLNSCIDMKTKTFPKSDDGVYDSFDDLLLIDQYVAASLLSHFCYNLSMKNNFLDLTEYNDNSIEIDYEKFNNELIFYSVYQFLSNGIAPFGDYVDMYEDIVKNKVISYKEWEKLNIQN